LLSPSTILNKMGFHRNLPQSLVFAPCELGGIGLCNLRYEMEIQQIIILLRHLQVQTTLGKAMTVLLHQCQLSAGIHRLILEDTQACPWIPDRWISQIQCTMQTYNIKIIYDAWTILTL